MEALIRTRPGGKVVVRAEFAHLKTNATIQVRATYGYGSVFTEADLDLAAYNDTDGIAVPERDGTCFCLLDATDRQRFYEAVPDKLKEELERDFNAGEDCTIHPDWMEIDSVLHFFKPFELRRTSGEELVIE